MNLGLHAIECYNRVVSNNKNKKLFKKLRFDEIMRRSGMHDYIRIFLQTYNLIRDFLSIHAFNGWLLYTRTVISKYIEIIELITGRSRDILSFDYQIFCITMINIQYLVSITFCLYHIIIYFYNKDTFHGKMNLTFASSFISKHNLREINNSKNP